MTLLDRLQRWSRRVGRDAADALSSATGAASARLDHRTDRSVVVVGAGLAAASRLQARGARVTVLEGRDRIGGRVWTEDALGVPLDLGASWIHGYAGNPLTELAEQLGVATQVSPWTSIALYDADGRRLDDAAQRQAIRAQQRLGERLHARYKALHASPELRQTSVWRTAQEQAERLGLTPDERLVWDWSLHVLPLAEGVEADHLSLSHFSDGPWNDGTDLLVTGGYQRFAEALADGLDLRLQARVTRIEHGPDGVRVETDAQGAFEADVGVVTLPLGVLKAGDVTFAPALPEWKRGAIERLGFGTLNKLAMRFDRVRWPADAPYIGRLTTDSGIGFFLNLAAFTGDPILIAFTAGEEGRWLEAASDATLIGVATRELRAMFGAALPEPLEVRRTRWGRDPFARGGYAHITASGAGADHDTLARPVGRRLLFAGEATNGRDPATAHGALESGLREADRILRLS